MASPYSNIPGWFGERVEELNTERVRFRDNRASAIPSWWRDEGWAMWRGGASIQEVARAYAREMAIWQYSNATHNEERIKVTNTAVADHRTPIDIAMKAMAAPETNTSLVLYRQQVAQAEHEIALMKRVPEMKVQTKNLKERVAILKRCVKASKAGFAEFRPAQSWYSGYLSTPEYKILGVSKKVKGGYSLYTRAIPAQAIIAFNKAKDLKVFDHFSVHSPDGAAFKNYAPVEKPVRIDPVLIGWINTECEPTGSGNLSGYQQASAADEIHPFLIAAWDLGADLALAQGLLAAPTSA